MTAIACPDSECVGGYRPDPEGCRLPHHRRDGMSCSWLCSGHACPTCDGTGWVDSGRGDA